MERLLKILGFLITFLISATFMLSTSPSRAWHDETHLAIAKVAGYSKWYNAAGADIAKIKAGRIEANNHYSNNPLSHVITPDMVLSQVSRYNSNRSVLGHLYGAIIASVRNYIKNKQGGKYAEYHLAYCVHYVGDLSQPLHNMLDNPFNRKRHAKIDGILEGEVLDNLDRIHIYPITIDREEDIAKEIARIANLSKALGYKIEAEDRLLTKEEAYRQISHSASLLKAILNYAKEEVELR